MEKRKKLIIAVIVVTLAVIVVATLVFRNGKEDGVLRLSGNMEVTEADLGFKIPGRLSELLVDEGSRVKEGDVLARLDAAEIEAVVVQNRAVLSEAKTRLAELRAGLRPQEIAKAKAQVNLQAAELARQAKEFERAKILHENGAISTSQFDAAKSAFESRKALHRTALEELSLAREGARREEIEAAEEKVRQAKAALDAAGEKLRDTVLRAPMNGVILKKNTEKGEIVAAGIPAVTLGDLDDPWIKVYVKEDRYGIVKLGQRAEVSVDSFPGKTYEGMVSYIASEAEFTPKSVQTEEERVKLVYGVKVRVKNEKGELKPGMPADVRIYVAGQGAGDGRRK